MKVILTAAALKTSSRTHGRELVHTGTVAQPALHFQPLPYRQWLVLS